MNLIGAEKLAELFGVNKPTVYKWVKERRVPHYKVGRAFRFNLDEVLEYARQEPERPFRKE